MPFAADAQRHEGLPGERTDQIVQVRLCHHRRRRPQLSPVETRLQIDGQLLAVRRTRQEHPQEQAHTPRSRRIPSLGNNPTISKFSFFFFF